MIVKQILKSLVEMKQKIEASAKLGKSLEKLKCSYFHSYKSRITVI